MTRLIPTRDRAQATRFDRYEAKRAAGIVGASSGSKGYLKPDADRWIVQVSDPQPSGAFWSGPWYVQEVAE